MEKHGVKIMLLLAVVIIAGGMVFYAVSQRNSVGEEDVLDKCRNLNIPEMQRCFTVELMAFAKETSFREALLAIQRARDVRPDLYYNCHFISHSLGKAAYNHFRDIMRALEEAEGTNVCLWGYYHDALIEYTRQNFSTFPSGQAIVEKTCKPLMAAGKRQAGFDCYHGVGHGLLGIYDFNLVEALKQCDTINDEDGRFVCYGGAFMENAQLARVVRVNSEENFSANYPFFKAGDPFYPCRRTDEKYRDICYFNSVQQYFLEVPPKDAAVGVFTFCRKVPEKDKNHCFEGIGVFRGYRSGWDINVVRESCLRGESFDEQKSCVIGAASRYRRMGGEELIKFCSNLPKELATPCIESRKNPYFF